jgi:Protein of unknown function (DUF3102)
LTELAGSNSLPDLAARIRIEHRAASDKLSEALAHAMAAGDLLIEAKALVPHGGWLPWLAANVEISDRTAQVYMRAAKNRAEIEANAQSAADLSLGEAMALLALSSDVRKLLSFVKQCEGLNGEELVQACLDANIPVVVTPGYDPFHGQSDEHRREWKLFGLWLMPQLGPEGAPHHVEWLLQRPFQNVSEWLGEEGEKCRRAWGMRRMPDAGKADWASFSASHALHTEAEIEAAAEAKAVEVAEQQAALKAEHRQQRPARRLKRPTMKRRA